MTSYGSSLLGVAWLGLWALSCNPASPPAVPRPSPPQEPLPQHEFSPLTHSPRYDDHATPDTSSCGIGDEGLRKVAERTLDDYIKTGVLPNSETLVARLRDVGLPYVWVRAWAGHAASRAALFPELGSWATSNAPIGSRRCGLAFDASQTRAVALQVDVLADVAPIPRQGSVGQWLPFEARLWVPVTEVALIALGPKGLPHGVPVTTSAEGRVRAHLPLAAPGRWLFQLLPTTESGARPAAEIEVFVGQSIPQNPIIEPVPGETSVECSDEACDVAWLLDMVNRARDSERLPPLQRSPMLEQLARQHADAMRDARRLAHDLGEGDAYIRSANHLPSLHLLGENLAHAGSTLDAHRALWRSPSHRRNLLHRDHTHMGVGVARGERGDLWVCQLFAAEEAPSGAE
jgi:uncharacterized protein YkwD